MTIVNRKTVSAACAIVAGVATFANMSPVTAMSDTRLSGVLTDSLIFGDSTSESAHAFSDDGLSRIVPGGLGDSARILLPRTPNAWEGGTVSFTLKVDPERQNYFTIRLWGHDVNVNRLILLCEGKQIGYRHLGDIDLLDSGADQPAYNNRFFYTTTPLPIDMTRGKTEIHFQIRSNGRIWGYGANWDQYQKPMVDATRGIYRVYTHTDPTFTPPAAEKQGAAPAHPPVRSAPGIEVFDTLKERVNHEIAGELQGDRPLNQMQMQFLARAYRVSWTLGYRNPKVISRVRDGLDALHVGYRKDVKLMRSDPATPNPDWFGFGPAGDAVWRLASELKPSLDESIPDGSGGTTTRRAAWAEMLRASCDWNSRHRRQYTNQSMIIDLNVALANNGLAVVDPAQALPQSQILRYLHESVGLEPWLGSETGHGPDRSLGDRYMQLTAKGLTKELGFVGYYGEVLDWVTMIYDATGPGVGLPGDERIKQQLIKIARTRGIFRYPMLDSDGNRAMRIEAVVGWRDEGHYPGDVAYGERVSWDGSALYQAAATLDPHSVGYAQQMIADGQFFRTVQAQTEQNNSLRVTAGLLGIPDQYTAIMAQKKSRERLPMTPGAKDFAWADEEDGVLAVKHGDETLYASLYWRARTAVNFLARVHYTVPAYDRIAVVYEDASFTPSGMTYTVPDWTNFDFADGGLKYPDGIHSAHAGLKLPIARIPDGVPFKPGDESPYAGRASFYRLRYGSYLIGMNCSPGETFRLDVPEGTSKAPDLISGKTIKIPKGGVPVKPMSTVVLYLGGE